MGWLYGGQEADTEGDNTEDEDDENDEDVVDLSELSSDDVVESGVTSGADPSNWDPIEIDKKP